MDNKAVKDDLVIINTNNGDIKVILSSAVDPGWLFTNKMMYYYYPDGTTASLEPFDGQVFNKYDPITQKITESWMYDSYKGQWFKQPVSSPASYKKGGIRDKGIEIKFKIPDVCECGSEKVGSSAHSSWCPKHKI